MVTQSSKEFLVQKVDAIDTYPTSPGTEGVNQSSWVSSAKDRWI